MKSYMLVLTVALFGAIVMIEAGGGKHGKKGMRGMGMMMNMTCLGETMSQEEMWKGTKECGEEMKAAAGGDKQEGENSEDGGGKGKGGKCKGKWGKMRCFQVCVSKKQGVLNSDGDYDSAGADARVKAAFPAKAYDAVKKAMDGCASKIGDKATRMDNNCAGYKDFQMCLKMDVFGKACGNEEMMKKWQEKMEKWQKNKGKKGGDGQQSPPPPEDDM